MPVTPITSADERPQPSTGAGFCDAVTFSFGDLSADVFAVARIALDHAADGATRASGLAIVFSDGEPVVVEAADGLPLAEATFDAVDAAGVRTSTVTALTQWTLAVQDTAREVALDLTFTALSVPGKIPGPGVLARPAGLPGYEQLCRVTGTATVRGVTRTVEGLGQRGHRWGAPDWHGMTMTRAVSAWVGDDLAVSLTAVREAKAKSHADEALQVTIFTAPPGTEDLAAAVVPEDSRLSTTYDADGRVRSAGLELYEDEDGYPRRGAGDVLCGTSLDLGELRLDCAFLRWRLDGRDGVGRYEVLRRIERR